MRTDVQPTSLYAWNEGMIARAISQQTLAKKCVVLVDNCNWTGHECDVLGVTTDLRIIDVEVKISRADLKADAKKSKWWHRTYIGQGPAVPTARGGVLYQSIYESVPLDHPRKVWKHYYALPAEIWKPELVDALPSKSSGILLLHRLGHPHQGITVTCERRATPSKDAYRLKPEQVMDIARLANLRMWEAYARRDTAFSDLNAQLQMTATEASGLVNSDQQARRHPFESKLRTAECASEGKP